MTVPISYPGVYITEIPSGSRTIVGVATSITAFVGAASRGPADVPVTIFSFADFERTFGGLSRTSGPGYAVRDFYQNGGGEALIVRLVHMATDARPRRAAPGRPVQLALHPRRPRSRRTWTTRPGRPPRRSASSNGPSSLWTRRPDWTWLGFRPWRRTWPAPTPATPPSTSRGSAPPIRCAAEPSATSPPAAPSRACTRAPTAAAACGRRRPGWTRPCPGWPG